jgi:bacterioferritin
MQHAERIIGRMLALGVAPNASCLRPVRLDGALPQLMQHAAALEGEIVSFYAQAVRYCSREQDHENRIFFEALLLDEQRHASGIESWQQQIVSGQTAAVS